MAAKITDLQAQKRNPNRVNVYLDGVFAFGLSRIVSAWLAVGQELSPEKIARLKEEDAAELALQRSLHFLSYRPRSEKEITDHLRKHKTPTPVLEQVLERLKANGMVDDLKFAQMWLENRSTFRPRGAFALRTELRQKGIADSTIEQVLDGLDERELAYQAGRNKAAKIRSSDDETFKKKLYGFLSRRGFSYGTISEVMIDLLDER